MHSGKISFLTKRHHPTCKSPRKRRLVSRSHRKCSPGRRRVLIGRTCPPAHPAPALLSQSAGLSLSPGKTKPATRPRITALPAQARPLRTAPFPPSPRHTASPEQGGLILSSASPELVLNCAPRRQVAVTAVMTPTWAGPEARLRRAL